MLYIEIFPLPVAVTTRIIIFLMGDPHEPVLPIPSYISITSGWLTHWIQWCTLPETNIAPENRPSQLERIVFQPSIFRGELLVAGRVQCGLWFKKVANVMETELRLSSNSMDPSSVSKCWSIFTGKNSHSKSGARWWFQKKHIFIPTWGKWSNLTNIFKWVETHLV